ncbi:MAG: Hpt domain-containing protein [Pseudomonadota bacterium]
MNTPVIDPAQLDTIRQLQQPGSENLLNGIIGLFLEQSDSQLQRLHAALDSGSVSAICELAHTLKSSSANVGAMRVSALSYDLEQAGRDGALSACTALIDRLDLAIREASGALQEIAEAEAA